MVTGSRAYYTQDSESYSMICGTSPTGTGSCAGSGLAAIDVGLSVVEGGTASGDVHTVSVSGSSDGTTLILTVQSLGDKTCWGIWDSTSDATFQGAG